MCQWTPAWAQLLHCCPARLPDVASAAFSHVDWNQHYISFACVLSSLLLSVLLCCPLLIVHAAHSANEPVQAQSAFYERDSHIFKGEIKPHITTAQMEQRHMTDNHVQKKKKQVWGMCLCREKQPLILPTITVSFCLLLSTCVPAAIKDPGGSNQGITRMAECEFIFKTLNIYICMYICVCVSVN